MVKGCSITALLFLQCLVIFILTNYGGIRPPDSEVVFRSAEIFSHQRSFEVAADLESWPSFGVARGRNDLSYSVYPPGEMVVFSLMLPVIERISDYITPYDWDVSRSHYVGNALEFILEGTPGVSSPEQRVRFVASYFDVCLSALGVVIFWLILLRLTLSTTVSYLTAVMYAFATPVWSYAGSFFSEPLAALLLLLSFLALLFRGGAPALAAGVFLGLSTATHLTALLFGPFFALYRFGLPRTRETVFEFLNWLTGLVLVLGLIGYFNWVRFESVFESGRGLSVDNQVRFVSLFSEQLVVNFSNVLFSPGKGLFIICPAALLGMLAWKQLHRADARLSWILFSCLCCRVCFNALYVDWHAGFGLGPRYLYLIFPFLLLPCAFWLKAHLCERRALFAAAVAFWLCIIEQWYFALGEIFSFYHRINLAQGALGIDVFYHDRIYTEWRYSPVMHLLEYQRGPILLKQVAISNQALWFAGAVVWLMVTTGIFLLLSHRISARARTLPVVQ